MPVTMRFTPSTRKKKPTKPKNSLAALNDSLSSSTKKKIASLTRKRRTRLLNSFVKKIKTKQETKKKKKAATTIQERARAKIQGKKTRKQIKENYEIDNQCAICLDTMINNGPTTKTKCGHKFHSECIERWLTDYNNNTCPSCREILVERDTDDEEDEREEGEADTFEEEEEDPAVLAAWAERRRAWNDAMYAASLRGRSRGDASVNLMRRNYVAAMNSIAAQHEQQYLDNLQLADAWVQAAVSAYQEARTAAERERLNSWAAAEATYGYEENWELQVPMEEAVVYAESERVYYIYWDYSLYLRYEVIQAETAAFRANRLAHWHPRAVWAIQAVRESAMRIADSVNPIRYLQRVGHLPHREEPP